MNDRDQAADWTAPGPVAPDTDPTSAWPAPPATAAQAGQVPGSQPYAAARAAAPTVASWQPGFMPLRPLSFGDLLGLPFKAMRYNRGVIVGGPLLLTLAATVLMTAGMWLLFTDPSLALMDPYSQADSISGTTVAVLVVAVVAALLADVFSSAFVAPGVARGALGERIRLADAWRAVRPRIGSLLLLYVIASVAVLVVIALGAVPLIIAIAAENVVGIVVGVLVVLAVALPAGFAFMLVSGLARPIVVLERRGAVAALRRAAGLIKGRFWWSVLVVFVATILIGIVSSVINQVGNFASLFVTLAAPDNMIVLGIVFVLVVAVALVVSYVLTYSYLGSLFALMLIDLRIRHEGFDLTLAEAAEARRA